MNSSTLIRTVGTAPSCAPVTVLPHAVAHATLPVTYAGIPAGRTAALSMITGPIFDDHKCTGASVPGRRGGT